jgi:hypothetical protein
MITLALQPQELEPTYNPIIIVATSSKQDEKNYLMIGDLTVRGVTVSRLRVQENPDGVFLFDLHKHIEREISGDFNPVSTGWSPATQSAATYSLSLGDQWRPEWTFEDNFFLPGAKLGFIGTQSEPPDGFATGSQIIVTQTAPFTFSQYNGLATIVAIIATQSPIPGYTGSHWIIETNKTFLGSTPKNGGVITLAGFQTAIDTGVISTTNSLWAFNGVRTFLEDISWNYLDYRAGSTTSAGTASFLTDAPESWTVPNDGRMWLLTFNPNSTEYSASLEVITNRGHFRLANTFISPSPTNNQPHLNVGCGPWHLGQTSSFTIVTGSFPIFDSTTTEYRVFVRGQSGATIIKPKTFKIDRKCAPYEKVQLVFLDALGSYIPYGFKMKKRENLQMSRQSWGQHYGRYPKSSNYWQYNSFDRGKTTLDTVVTEIWQLTTDWLSNTDSEFMVKLLQSPDVYYIDEVGTTLAVNITNTEVERKKTLNDQIINYTITVELSQKNSSQRG